MTRVFYSSMEKGTLEVRKGSGKAERNEKFVTTGIVSDLLKESNSFLTSNENNNTRTLFQWDYADHVSDEESLRLPIRFTKSVLHSGEEPTYTNQIYHLFNAKSPVNIHQEVFTPLSRDWKVAILLTTNCSIFYQKKDLLNLLNPFCFAAIQWMTWKA